MTLDEVRIAIANCEDVRESDVAALLESSDKAAREAALTALTRTRIREALVSCAWLAHEQGYTNQSTLTAVQHLASLSDIDEPLIEVMKALGVAATSAGRFDEAMKLLQEATDRAARAGLRRDPRSRRSVHFAHDREVDEAVRSLAARVEVPRIAEPSKSPFRIAITCSAIQDEDGPTVIIVMRAEHFRRLGYEVDVVSTEMVQTHSAHFLQRLQAAGARFYALSSGSPTERTIALVRHFMEHPVHAISWTTSAYDNLGKLGACMNLAPVQSWDNRSIEPFVGNFDLVYQGVSPSQETTTNWPGLSKYYGSSVAMAEQIDAAPPLARATLGVPDDAVLLGTFGRMEKANTDAYLLALESVLKRNPNAWLILAGRDALGAADSISRFFSTRGLGDRVRYLGPRQSDAPALVKTIDVYCDTFPWVGGQTTLDAMQAGKAIVAMRAARDHLLDPAGVTAVTAVAESLLDGLIPLANAGDTDAYAQIASTFIVDRVARAHAGEVVREKATRDCNAFQKSAAYAGDLEAIYARKKDLIPS